MTSSPLLQVLAAVTLVGVAAPAGRLLVDRELRRLFPRLAAGLAALLTGWVLVVVAIAVVWPAALVPLALIALVAAGAATWRARPGFGSRRNLPPGTLSLTSSVGDLAHRDAYARAAARHGPVFKSAQFVQPVVCVIGLERGQRLVRDHAEAIGPSPLPFTQQLVGDFLRYMDDDTHDRYGPLFRRALAGATVRATVPVAEAAARRELDRLPRAMAPEPGRAVPLDPMLQRIAHEIVVHALLGLRAGTARYDQCETLAATFAERGIMHPLDRRARAVLDQLRAAVVDQAAALGADPAPPDCALGDLQAHDPAMPDPVAIDNLVMMAKIGTANMVGLLRWMVVLLDSEPTWAPRLRAALDEPAPADGPDLFDAFVLETLRLAQSEYVYRRLTRDVTFDGHRLPRGWLVRVCVAESHRDPDVFAHPEQATDRFAGRRPGPSELCPFGFGRHACNAAGLATTVARSLLVELARSPDLVVFHDGRLTREPRHWSHWRPAPPVLVMFQAAEAPGD